MGSFRAFLTDPDVLGSCIVPALDADAPVGRNAACADAPVGRNAAWLRFSAELLPVAFVVGFSPSGGPSSPVVRWSRYWPVALVLDSSSSLSTALLLSIL
jgi:hypothetical protein